MRTFIIAEIGVNHNGDSDLALRLIEEAARAGADAAKFQSFKADTLATKGAGTVTYQKTLGASSDQHEMLKRLELSEDLHMAVVEHCNSCGIEFMSTAFDRRLLDFLIELGMKRIKVPSGEVTNIPYLEDCARRGLPIILSTGMADMEETRRAVQILSGTDLTVLHCTTAYPTEPADVNLSAMLAVARELDVAVGYSDHTTGISIPPLAVAAGATVIEKHFTLDRTLPGPDHPASIEPAELREMVERIREVELILGDGIKRPTQAEMEARTLVRRGLKAARDIPAGTVLAEADIAILRPATGLEPARLRDTIGRRVATPVAKGDPIEEGTLSKS